MKKQCGSCKKTKSVADFYQRNNGSLQSYCKSCACDWKRRQARAIEIAKTSGEAGMTQDQVAAILGVSRVTVQNIERSALAKLARVAHWFLDESPEGRKVG
jgi:DNA-binding XRE family transcriptional regulator